MRLVDFIVGLHGTLKGSYVGGGGKNRGKEPDGYTRRRRWTRTRTIPVNGGEERSPERSSNVIESRRNAQAVVFSCLRKRQRVAAWREQDQQRSVGVSSSSFHYGSSAQVLWPSRSMTLIMPAGQSVTRGARLKENDFYIRRHTKRHMMAAYLQDGVGDISLFSWIVIFRESAHTNEG